MNKIFSHHAKDSYFNKLRRKRFVHFLNFLKDIKRPLKILDVGGSELFWQMMDFNEDKVEITILNLAKLPIQNKRLKSVAGDGRDINATTDKYYDVVFSNSVIEHLGTFEDQFKMAGEVKRVGKNYYIQTPNKFFPIEPHFLFPLFQFLPFKYKVWLCTNFSLGHIGKLSRTEAEDQIKSIGLISKQELIKLFPNSKIYKEKFLGINKSFTVFGESR